MEAAGDNSASSSGSRAAAPSRSRSSSPAAVSSSARPLNGSRGFSGIRGRAFGFGAFGAGTPVPAPTTSVQTSIITAGGALVRSPEMFTLKQPTGQAPQWFSVPAGGIISIDESKAQALGGAGVFIGEARFSAGNKSQPGGKLQRRVRHILREQRRGSANNGNPAAGNNGSQASPITDSTTSR